MRLGMSSSPCMCPPSVQTYGAVASLETKSLFSARNGSPPVFIQCTEKENVFLATLKNASVDVVLTCLLFRRNILHDPSLSFIPRARNTKHGIDKTRRVPPAPWRYDMVASGVTLRSYRSSSMIAEDLSLRAWMVVATPLRPWCGGGDAEESGMYPGVWDSLGFLPNR